MKKLSKINRELKPKDFKNFYCDFETVIHKDIHYVSCYSIVGENSSLAGIINISNQDDLLKSSNKLLLEFIDKCFNIVNKFSPKQTKVLFFFHNLNKFDSYFLLNTFANNDLFNIRLISKNNQIYKIVATHKQSKRIIEFRDSLLLLPIPLELISERICDKYTKKVFDIEITKVSNYIDNENFKLNVLNYCLQDALVLQEGFEKFLNLIRLKFNIEPLNCLSLPGVSLRYFRLNFYDDINFPIERLPDNKDIFIRKSYRGGSADVYKPYLINGFHYDVNSLYPYIMQKFDMPIGTGEWTTEIDINNFFGFIKVEVTSPKYMHKPFLNYYHKDYGLITPVGCWTEVYFSEEIKHAITLGYTFKFLRGISYNRGILFDKFIKYLYELRLQNEKGTPLNLLIKLLMNSLYGRFGMKSDILKSKIIDNNEINKYVSIYDVTNISNFEFKSLISYYNTPVKEKLDVLLNNNYLTLNDYNKYLKKDSFSLNESSAVQIASAITAYSRIFMDKFKRSSELDVYYSDTDSIFCKHPLDPKYVSDTELGLFKLENTITEAVFLAPKIYMLKNTKGETIIKCKGLNNNLVSESDIYNLYNKPTNFILKLISYFKRNTKTFIISQHEIKINISAKLLKRKKIYLNKKWVDTTPLEID